MKKYLPAIIFAIAFSGFLAAQIGFDLLNLKAQTVSKDKKLNAFYTSLYKKTVVETVDKRVIELKNIEAPILILTFWASWCSPCIEELQSLKELKDNLSDDKLMVVAINNDDTDQRKNIIRTIKQFDLNFPIVADTTGAYTNTYMVSAIPFSILFYKGKVVEIVQGAKDYASGEMREKILNLLDQRD